MASALALMLIPLTTILRGLVLSIVWSWFFVKALGVPQINVAQAIGIVMIVSFLTKDPPAWDSDAIDKEFARIEGLSEEEREANQKKAAKKFLESIKKTILHSLIFLFLAWIVHQFA